MVETEKSNMGQNKGTKSDPEVRRCDGISNEEPLKSPALTQAKANMSKAKRKVTCAIKGIRDGFETIKKAKVKNGEDISNDTLAMIKVAE